MELLLVIGLRLLGLLSWAQFEWSVITHANKLVDGKKTEESDTFPKWNTWQSG